LREILPVGTDYVGREAMIANDATAAIWELAEGRLSTWRARLGRLDQHRNAIIL